MNINQGTPMRPPYNAKINETLSTGYNQQGQSILTGSSMMVGIGDYPINCNCPHCYQPIVTKVEKNNGLMTWLTAGGICLLGCFCGCCLIPFCINELKDTIHYCPNCNRIIAQNKML